MSARQGVGAVLFLALAACGSATPPPASTAEMDAVTTALSNCLGQAAERLDDGKSDAATIALAMQPMCATQFSQFEEANGRTLNPAAYNLYLAKVRPHRLEVATGIVLRVRAVRAGGK